MEKKPCSDPEVRKGPWTMEEDLILINYIGNHGQGVWNDLARSAGLKRTGKSCRLRWLNYLRPDVRRGNITPEEQMLIVELHSRWGNRWSKIAKQMPGRTDNEIKNFWRTRIQKKTKNDEVISDDVNQYTFPIQMQGASASFASGMDDCGMELCSPMYTGSTDMDTFMDDQSHSVMGEGFWSVDDLWSMQLFHND